ncbi:MULTISPECIES: ATP-binding protein [unclassified Nocardiopsis]|uniref:ATP-binding protein n=1 Tax=unclassified Nocardiopsis TaxID=2649073 RepID=UPI001357EEF4|nr:MULTISPECIES: ATP-binding protein [unclassified Nocardiopsis]
MNETTPARSGPAAAPGRRSATVAPPWRLRFAAPDRCGIVLGPDPGHVALARTWARPNARDTARNSHDLVLAVSILVTNALEHTRSGDPGGTVQVVLYRRPATYTLSVTDNGPRPGPFIPVPRMEASTNPLSPTGNGLRLLDALCAYWDWSGSAGEPLTVRAVLDRTTSPRSPRGPGAGGRPRNTR